MALCRIHDFRWLADPDLAYCFLSRLRNADTAIVFVHGFMGNSIDTWQHFPAMIDELRDGIDWWASCDLYFWNYRSAEQTINQSAFHLRRFLQEIVPGMNPRLFALDGADSPADQEYVREQSHYRRLILVGHSQGGVVIRQMVVDGLKQWVSEGKPHCSEHGIPTFYSLLFEAKVHLFSPALHGTALTGLPSIINEIPITRWLFEALLNATSPSYRQLKPDSVPLGELQRSTVNEHLVYGFPALSAKIYYAGNDAIVSDQVYPIDPPAEYISDHSHASVCKPNRDYLKPLELIQHANSESASAA